MALPLGWPPKPNGSLQSLRVFIAGTATGDWTANAYLFAQVTGGNPTPLSPRIEPGDEGVVVTGIVGQMGGQSGAASTQAVPQTSRHAQHIRVKNDGANPLHVSFDASAAAVGNVAAILLTGEERVWNFRYEAGIALRGPSGDTAFRVEAW